MTLPISRDATFTAGSQWPSATANRIQDVLIEGAHASQEFWLAGPAFAPDLDVGEDIADLLSGGEWWSSDTFPYEIDCPLPMIRVGDRILEIQIFGVAGSSAGEIMTGQLYRRGGATGSPTAVSTTKTSSPTSGQANLWWTIADTDFTPSGHVVQAGGYFLECNMPVTSSPGDVKVYAIKIRFDRPLP